MPLRIVMLGTGDFAVPALQSLIASPHAVAGLVTQPDRTGRGHHQHVNPMKELASKHGIAVFQPEKVNSPEALQALREFQAELFVVAAYGQILSADLLRIPRLGAINLHASLLPKYRGAAPVQYAVLKGETETGVTIFQIEPRLDAGPILGVERTAIGPRETSGQLEVRLAEMAAPLTLTVVNQLESGTAQPVFQDRTLVSKAPKIPKVMGEIDWTRTSAEIGCHIRAMQPWPMPCSYLHTPGHPALRLLILQSSPVGSEYLGIKEMNAMPGSILDSDTNVIRVRTGDAAVDILNLQPASKRPMSAQAFRRGYIFNPDSRFGPEISVQKP